VQGEPPFIARAMRAAREDLGARAWAVRAIAGLGLAAGVSLSAGVWRSVRAYPTLPVLPFALPLPPAIDGAVPAVLAILAVVAALAPARRAAVIAAIAPLVALLAFDQQRWQPWALDYVLILSSFAQRAPAGAGDRVLGPCRFVVASFYVWSGIQKLNATFAASVFPRMFPAAAAHLPAWAWILAPAVEIAVGAGLVVPRTRNAAVVLAVAMHAAILAALGPLGLDYNRVVWPWNVARALLCVALFWRTPGAGVAEVVPLRQGAFGRFVVVACGVMPALCFLGAWDLYLSAGVYSGEEVSASWELSPAARAALPDLPRAHVHGAPPRLGLQEWALAELGVPPYPEERVAIGVGRAVCALAGEARARGVTLVLRGRPSRLTGAREERRATCAELGPGP
jgi:hypothetical protein